MTRAPDGPGDPTGTGQGSDAPGAGEPTKKPSRYLTGRMIGAARLDGAVFRAVRDDRFGTFQALQVVLLAALSAAMSGTLLGGDPRVALAAAVLGWLAWVFVTHLTVTRALGLGEGNPDWNRLLRTTGMALTPAVLLLFSPVPFVGLVFFVVGLGWTAVAMTAAVRHTYDGATWSRAVQASLVGWLAAGLVYAAIVLINSQLRGS